ncbi:MAG: glutamine-hydrolyzing GMP synthase [Candidatus Sericytochromatia bacterium]
MHETIAILDYGSQYTQLIARRVRELGVYSAILPPDVTADELKAHDLKGIVLSGGPNSVYAEGSPGLPDGLLDLGVPVLGVCYGMQLLAHTQGGKVVPSDHREYGLAKLTVLTEDALFAGLGADEPCWMSHGDRVEALPEGFRAIANSGAGVLAAMSHPERRIYALQFHPEVTHTVPGRQILSNFLFDICRCAGDWDLADYVDEISAEIRAQVGDRPVVSLVSGGVDSTVATALLLKALPAEQVYALHIDSGLMRRSESLQVMGSLEALGLRHLRLVEAEAEFLAALAGKSDPEEKRHAIGDTFIEVQERELAAMGLPANAFLCQGTLYTDLIESGHGKGGHSATIKTHHNVGTPAIKAKREAGLVVEPNKGIFKDEVRAMGERLGLSHDLVHRHPFPGPGLGIRVLGEVTKDKLEILRRVDEILVEELHARKLYDKIWQAFAVLPDAKSVGVMGDFRTYEHVAVLRAVTSIDGMTADAYHFPWDDLTGISRRITNEVRGVNRVVYDVSSKPPSTIEWE